MVLTIFPLPRFAAKLLPPSMLPRFLVACT